MRQRTTQLRLAPFGRRTGGRSLLHWLSLYCLSVVACDGAEPAAATPDSPSTEQRSTSTPSPIAEESPEPAAEEAPPPLPSAPPEDGAPVLPVPGSEGRAPVNQILFKLTGGAADRSEAERVARSVDGELVSHLESVGLYTIRVPAETMEELGESMERVAADPAVETAMHNWVAELY